MVFLNKKNIGVRLKRTYLQMISSLIDSIEKTLHTGDLFAAPPTTKSQTKLFYEGTKR